MAHIKRALPFSILGLVLIILSQSEYQTTTSITVKYFSLYLAALGLLCLLSTLLYTKYPKLLMIIKFTVVNIALYLIFSFIYAWFISKNLLFTGLVGLFGLILSVLLRGLYKKAHEMMLK